MAFYLILFFSLFIFACSDSDRVSIPAERYKIKKYSIAYVNLEAKVIQKMNSVSSKSNDPFQTKYEKPKPGVLGPRFGGANLKDYFQECGVQWTTSHQAFYMLGEGVLYFKGSKEDHRVVSRLINE